MTTALIVGGYGAVGSALCRLLSEDSDINLVVGGRNGDRADELAEVAALAFEVLGQPVRVSRVPEWLTWTAVRLVRLFNRHQGELLAFFLFMSTTDVVAPPTGTHTLEAHYRTLGGEP